MPGAAHAQQLQPSPGGSPLSAGFPPLSRSGMTPTLGFEDEFISAAGMGLSALGVNVNDFTFNTSPGHGSPLALA